MFAETQAASVALGFKPRSVWLQGTFYPCCYVSQTSKMDNILEAMKMTKALNLGQSLCHHDGRIEGAKRGDYWVLQGRREARDRETQRRQSSNPGREEGRASRCEVEGARLEGFLRKKEMPH